VKKKIYILLNALGFSIMITSLIYPIIYRLSVDLFDQKDNPIEYIYIFILMIFGFSLFYFTKDKTLKNND
jgi:hypothetical protein